MSESAAAGGGVPAARRGTGITRASRRPPRRAGPSTPARRALAAAAVALVGLAAGCTGDTDEPPDPATTPAGPSPTAPPGVAATPGVGASPVASPVSGPATPVTSEAAGGAGTVADEAGDAPPTPEPSADLRTARVTLDAEAVTATLTLDGPPPRQASSLLWSVQLHVGGQRAYTVTLQQIGQQRTAAVFDWADREQTALPSAPEIAGDELTLTVPVRLVPRAADGFAWLAHTQLDGAWEDWLPSDRQPVEVAP